MPLLFVKEIAKSKCFAFWYNNKKLSGVEQIVAPVMIHIHKYEASQTSISLVLYEYKFSDINHLVGN